MRSGLLPSALAMFLLANGNAARLVAQPSPPVQRMSRDVPTAGRALRVGVFSGAIRVDGRLDELAWGIADSITDLVQVEPIEGGPPSGRTVVRVLANADEIIFGVRADDPEPSRLVSFARDRDAVLSNEDHIKIVLDTYRDGRSGYVFAVNPNGARYDALVSGQGETENANWDAVWQAASVRTATGWSVEIRIPIRSLLFKPGMTTWGFNVQRRAQRLQETDRWASAVRNFKVTQTFRAGLLTDVPPFTLGLGLSVRPSFAAGGGVAARGARVQGTHDESLDVTQNIGANTLAALTINTDFAETEVDTRRTNLTRFPLFFPEKRTFFLQGADIFDFGNGLGNDVRPFFSRRVGLLNGAEVPIRVGTKVSGRSGGTNYGALVVRTGVASGGGNDSTANTIGVLRVKQNVLRESSVGMITTVGDARSRSGSWTGGLDGTYQTSRFRGDKNLVAGVWGLTTRREALSGDRNAWGGLLDYPNDLWDINATYKHIGDGFDPSLGFVPRANVQIASLGVNYQPRPTHTIAGMHVRQMFHEFQATAVTDLAGRWQSYRMFMAPVNYRLESGDRFEFNVVPTGDRLLAPFEIATGVTIPAGAYHWNRYRLEVGTAAKRRVSTQATWWFGDFYSGHLNEMQVTASWKPSSLLILELNGTRNVGQLREGSFTQNLIGMRGRVNVSPDLQLNSYLQYDNESDTFGSNSRLRWTFSRVGDLFIVYNHNLRHDIDPSTGQPMNAALPTDPTQRGSQRWGFGSNQLLVKMQYAFRY